MRQVALGPRTVPCLGVGAMSFSDFYGETSDENSWAVLDAAAAAGVHHIDTANVYGMGRSERAIGHWLKANPGMRDRMHIATKGGINRTGKGAEPFDNSRTHLQEALDASLARLGVDCVDLYYVHRRQDDVEIEAVVEVLVGLVEAGKTRSFGFSEIAPHSLRRAQAVAPVAAVQSEYSLGTRLPELGLMQTCKELDVGFVAFSPVMRGLLTDAPVTEARVEANWLLRTNPRFTGRNFAENLAITDRFRKLAAEMEIPAAGLAVAWCLAQGDHVLPIPGTRSVAHFRDLVRGAQVDLTARDLEQIATVLPAGWAHGDRYSEAQWRGPEGYC